MVLKFILQCLLISYTWSKHQNPILIVVSYDAFRHDFFDTKTVPHMNRLRQGGTYADYMINVFPTKTFPNHHSIATGLYPEVHGVINNVYLNTETKQVVYIGYDMFHYNEKIVPIWRLNEDAGGGRHSGVMMWPGGCYPYQGKNITHCQEFDPQMDWHKRIDLVISWMKDPDKPTNLVMIYFGEPDTHGHIYGIGSDVVDNLVKKLDNVTNYLDQQLKANNLSDKTHVVHLSDHGMLDVKPPNFINVTQYLTPNTYLYAASSPIIHFYPNKGMESDVYNRLKNGARQNGHFSVYKTEEYPARWNFKNNPRSPPILVMADVGYAVDDLIAFSKTGTQKHHFNLTNECTFGVHGYDYTVPEMRPFFMARGPKIRANNKIAPFKNVDLFNMFCEILEIAPTSNNGTTSHFDDVLVATNKAYTMSTILGITVGGIVVVLILISCAAVLTLMMIKRQQNITTTAALNKRFPQTFQSSIEAQHLLDPEEA